MEVPKMLNYLTKLSSRAECCSRMPQHLTNSKDNFQENHIICQRDGRYDALRLQVNIRRKDLEQLRVSPQVVQTNAGSAINKYP
jgi:hypothetical protein